MGIDTEDVIDKLFNTLLQRFQRAQETSNERGSEFIPDSVELLYYHFQRIDIRRAESYIISPDWIASKKATRVDTDFSSYQRDQEEFEQNNTLIALNILFVSYNSEEIKLAYKSNYNKRKNQVILLMINDQTNNCYYFAVKNLSELNSLGWLRSKKEAIINGDNDFKNSLNDALNYQTIERHPEEY